MAWETQRGRHFPVNCKYIRDACLGDPLSAQPQISQLQVSVSPEAPASPVVRFPFACWRALPLPESSNLISFLPREVGKAWLEQRTVEDTQGLGVYFLGKAVPGS